MGRPDSVSIGEAQAASAGGDFGWKRALLLFLFYLFVVSDIFVNSFVSLVPGATNGRDATDSGYIIQGVCLVLLYALGLKLVDLGVL
jgi:hypothetical protein